MPKLKILHVVGARPNFIKIAPIMRALKKEKDIEQLLVHTGQHYDEKMSGSFFSELDIPHPDVHLNVGSNTHAKQVAEIMSKFEDVCNDKKPDFVLVVGDVNSTMACVLVAAKLGIKTVHVEAGIRSGDRTMPEEINRLVTDSIADYFLTPSPDAEANLLREGHSAKKIVPVGNIMIDTLEYFKAKVSESDILSKLGVEARNYACMTLHRPSNVDFKAPLVRILNCMDYLSSKMPIVLPLHPRTKKQLQTFGLLHRVEDNKNIILAEPLGYNDFGSLIRNAKMVLTDSGGIQEETTIYGVPCITLRKNTERPITVTDGTNILAGSDEEKIKLLIDRVIDNDWKDHRIPDMWDGKTAARIAQFFKKINNVQSEC